MPKNKDASVKPEPADQAYAAETVALETEYAQLSLSDEKRKAIDQLVTMAEDTGKAASRAAEEEGEIVDDQVKAMIASPSWQASTQRLRITTKLKLAYGMEPALEPPDGALFIPER